MFSIVQSDSGYGQRLVMGGAWAAGAAQAMKKHSIKSLELNYAKGWVSDDDVDFLRDIPDLRELILIDWAIEDVSAINALQNLESLDLVTSCKTELRFSSLPNLRKCCFYWRGNRRSIFECTALEELVIHKYSKKSAKDFSALGSLRRLQLTSSSLSDLSGIFGLQGLRALSLRGLRKIDSLEGIQAMAALEDIELQECPGVSDIAPLAALVNLRRVLLVDNGEFVSLSPLRGLGNLQELYFYGKATVRDNDLSLVTELKRKP